VNILPPPNLSQQRAGLGVSHNTSFLSLSSFIFIVSESCKSSPLVIYIGGKVFHLLVATAVKYSQPLNSYIQGYFDVMNHDL